MAKWKVRITENKVRTLSMQADSEEELQSIAVGMYENGEINMDEEPGEVLVEFEAAKQDEEIEELLEKIDVLQVRIETLVSTIKQLTID